MATAPGQQFADWTNLSSLTETLKGGKSPLLNTLGILLAGGSPEGVKPPEPSSGMGLRPSSQVGIAPRQLTSPSTIPDYSIPDYSAPQAMESVVQPEPVDEHKSIVRSIFGI